MNINEWESFLGFEDIMNMPGRIMEIVTGDRSERDDIYCEAIKLHGGDMSYDWFFELYEEELSQRKKRQQDFTPRQVSEIVALLTEADGIVHEPTAGTGGLLIQYWWNKALAKLPWKFKPSTCIVSCWELSDRSIPFLLFNLSIRGIMGEVFHGDVLENSARAHYVLLNERNDALAFSDIVRDDSILGYRYEYPAKNIQPSLFDKI